MARKRVGVIGGGQLAWMMAEAAQKLGIDLVIQTPHPDDPAVKIATETIFAAVDDGLATAKLASCCDVITFENEFVNLEALKPLAEKGVCFHPSLDALLPLLDKYHQRCYLKEIGLPVPRFIALDTGKNFPIANDQSPVTDSQFPLVLKVRRHGYDGQGTYIIGDRNALEATCKRLENTPLMIEEFIPFERELAVIAARSVAGEIVVYPVVETYQKDRVCHWVIAPADLTPEIKLEIERIARHLLEKLQFVGVFGIELFLTQDGKLLVNEIAPRTHNSGHYTLDACEISQFEMQLRAVTGLSLATPTLKCSGAVMVNLLGYEHSQSDYQEKRAQIAAIGQSYLHWYSKTESRPGRKLGHVTVLLEQNNKSPENLQRQLLGIAEKIESLWYGS
jgi:5-(carboxyamino)imidazole ribonucleotide synthase